MKILAIDSNHELLNEGLRNAGFQVDEDYSSPKEEIRASFWLKRTRHGPIMDTYDAELATDVGSEVFLFFYLLFS